MRFSSVKIGPITFTSCAIFRDLDDVRIIHEGVPACSNHQRVFQVVTFFENPASPLRFYPARDTKPVISSNGPRNNVSANGTAPRRKQYHKGAIRLLDASHRNKQFLSASRQALYWPGMAHLSIRLLSSAATLLASAYLASAHHGSNISYQVDKTITINGTVTEWDMVNPHPQIYFDVTNEQRELVHWAAELLPTPLMLKNMKVGWTRTTMKPGDQIVLTCNPSKVAGAKACLPRDWW